MRRAFAGAGWHVPALLDRLAGAPDLYFDEVAQVMMPRWSAGRFALLGDAAFAVSLIAGKGATLAMAGAVVLADALAEHPGELEAAFARYEARLRPWVEAAQRTARRSSVAITMVSALALSVPRAGRGRADKGGRRVWARTVHRTAGLPGDITPQVLRHSYASLAADLGLADANIAALLGHK